MFNTKMPPPAFKCTLWQHAGVFFCCGARCHALMLAPACMHAVVGMHQSGVQAGASRWAAVSRS